MTVYSLDFFPNFELVCCSMSSSNCCFFPAYRFLRRPIRRSGIPISNNCPHLVVIRPYRRFTRPSRTNTQKRCPFHYKGLKCKSKKLRNTWSNRQIWPWNEAGQRLIEFCQENALITANTLFQQHKRRLNTWTSPDS